MKTIGECINESGGPAPCGHVGDTEEHTTKKALKTDYKREEDLDEQTLVCV